MDPHILHNISYGMYIVSSHDGAKLNGQIANSVIQITSEPVTIAISINKANLTHAYVGASRQFTVSVLDEATPLPFIGKFGFKSGRAVDKFKDTRFETLPSGCPAVTEHALGYLEAKVIREFDCITHTLFFGEMTGSKMLGEGRPMTYAFYHLVKRGTTPASAPTYIKAEDAKP